jgi:hypothetical protein
MKIGIRYRIDSHRYDARTGSCWRSCPACAREAVLYDTADAAIRAQPAVELALEDGDQGGVLPPARRFQVVVVDFFA